MDIGRIPTTSVYERFLDAIIDRKIPYHEAVTGDVIPLGTLAFKVLYSTHQASSLNNTSLVMRLEYGTISVLLTGDAESEVEVLG